MRFALVTFLCLLGLLPLALASPASPVSAQGQDAIKLLTDAATLTSQQASFHFHIENDEGDTKIIKGVKFKEVDGDVQMPDRLDADIRAKAVLKTLTIQVRVIGPDLWSTDPVIGRFSGFKKRRHRSRDRLAPRAQQRHPVDSTARPTTCRGWSGRDRRPVC